MTLNSITYGQYICYTFDPTKNFTKNTLLELDADCSARCTRFNLSSIYGRSAMFRTNISYNYVSNSINGLGYSNYRIIFGAAAYANATLFRDFTWSSNGTPSTATISNQAYPVTPVSTSVSGVAAAFVPSTPNTFFAYSINNLYGMPYVCECSKLSCIWGDHA